MPSEMSPGGSTARMTKSQVKKYIKDMKKAQAVAQAKIDAAKNSGEMDKDKIELAELEKAIEDFV